MPSLPNPHEKFITYSRCARSQQDPPQGGFFVVCRLALDGFQAFEASPPEPSGAAGVCKAHPNQEDEMSNIEEQGMNDGAANKNMIDDPNWSAEERKQYQAAYSNAKKKAESQQQ